MTGGVAIVGVGGLGCPAALALARSGVSQLALFDGDLVEASNLPRQLLFAEADLGRAKVDAAAERLAELAPGCAVTRFATFAGPKQAAELSRWPIWIDATDGFATKLWLSDLAVASQRTLVHAGAAGLSGQALLIVPGAGPCLRCLVDAAGQAESCRERGILGPVAGLIGAVAAQLALQALHGAAVAGRQISWEAATGALHERVLHRRAGCDCQAVLPRVSSSTEQQCRP